MYTEDDLLPISALQHLLFCERQCALIHIEQAWAENRFTVEGNVLHERVHDKGNELRGDVRISRGVRLKSLRLGLTGVADVVEFYRTETDGVSIENMLGRWTPRPVEYKRGRPKPDECDKIQLCAQALCLEEMLGAVIESGDIFYGQPRRRLEVALTEQLRGLCEQTAERLHQLLAMKQTPSAKYKKKCRNCSLFDVCMPKSAGKGKSVSAYMAAIGE